MKKYLVIGVSLLLTAVMMPIKSAEALILDVQMDAYITDYDGATTIDGNPNSITNSQALFIGNGLLSSGNALESRGIVTFDISAYSSMILQSAFFSGFGYVNSGQVLSLSGYSGDGLVSLSDYNQAATFIGDMTLPLSTTGLFSHDVTSFAQSLLTNNDSFAELRINTNFTTNTGLAFDAKILAGEAQSPFTIPGGQQGPTLILDFVQLGGGQVTTPEPMTLALFGSGMLGMLARRRRE